MRLQVLTGKSTEIGLIILTNYALTCSISCSKVSSIHRSNLIVQMDHRDTGAGNVEVRAGMDTHGRHRYYQWCDPRRLVRQTRERAAGTSNFYSYGCPAVRSLHLAAPAHLETCVSR